VAPSIQLEVQRVQKNKGFPLCLSLLELGHSYLLPLHIRIPGSLVFGISGPTISQVENYFIASLVQRLLDLE
jgi:hypothetical protein